MARKTRTKKDEQIDFLEDQLQNNIKAIQEGPRKKRWSIHDLKNIKPLNNSQRMMMESYMQGNNIIASGSAGVGKSYLGLFLALNDLLSKDNQRSKIIIVRSATQTKEIGHLPGTVEEKLEPYELPYKDILHDLLGRASSYDDMKRAGNIEFICTSLIRGLSWDNAIVIVDEMQSMTMHEIDTVITRLGNNSILIGCGDIAQNDLIYKKHEVSGFATALKIFEKMEEIDIINFTENDIVRSAFVKNYIIAKQNL